MQFARGSGILLHPTSLPGPYGSGDLGTSAYQFVDWLASSGQALWQMLPLGPAGMANSPYMSLSAFAGSPMLIDLEDIVAHDWLVPNDLRTFIGESVHRVKYQEVSLWRMNLLWKASENFFHHGNEKDREQFASFCAHEKKWLDEYSLFQAVNDHFGGREWISWGHDLVHRKPAALKQAAEQWKGQVNYHKFMQWCFARQWKKLKKYANDRGIKLMGDIPIFVAHHSADVWSNQQAFSLDKDGRPSFVAGVPPDYFSEDGQRWGNPLYRWDIMKQQGYSWWINRFKKTFELFDILRIDHFRGFEAYWRIPAKEKTARVGKWIKGPGDDLFKAIIKKLGTLPIIAEDLGVVTPEVVALREAFGFPGMKVLQFAFSTDPKDNFLPHGYDKNYVVYTGTHDNDTTMGWYGKATDHERDFVRRYCKTNGNEINWDLMKLALQSVANIAVIPLQDVLGLGSEGRMNFPGTVEGNWEWRFSWEQLKPEMSERIYELTALYGRCQPDKLHLLGT
jgi:4-alpha-glucanotransferase